MFQSKKIFLKLLLLNILFNSDAETENLSVLHNKSYKHMYFKKTFL